MARYIDADALLLEDFTDAFVDIYDVKIFEHIIENAPTADVVEVVRCKDCKYGEIDDADFPDQYLCHHSGDDWNNGNHFCSYGERGDT